MAIELRQQLKLTQQLIMTPQLQMAIKLLQLSRLELMDMIHQEMEQNPALEDVQESFSEELETTELKQDDVALSNEAPSENKIREEIDWSNYMEEFNSPGRVHFETEGRDAPRYETFISQKQSLTDHLLWQFLMTSPSLEAEKIGSLIIGNLNKDGYLDVSSEEIAEMADNAPEAVESVLALLQTFNPVGVCARDIRECLLIQLRHYGFEEMLVLQIIENHLHHLENKNYKAVAKALGVHVDDVVCAVEIIKSLEPRPGRAFAEEEPVYISPDIYVYKFEDEFVIMLNDDGMPKLRVNSFYKEAITNDNSVNAQTRDYIQEKLRSAAWLIRSIHQRQKTIFRVMESIVKFQQDFFEKGITHLKPMVLRDVAQDIGMHESTISRVTTNKYAYTPQGIFELKYFFNSSISRVHGEAIASASVMQKIKEIVDGENPKKPYSDSKIAQLLKIDNINIARRTVAKYREMLKVLPSNKRKQF